MLSFWTQNLDNTTVYRDSNDAGWAARVELSREVSADHPNFDAMDGRYKGSPEAFLYLELRSSGEDLDASTLCGVGSDLDSSTRRYVNR